jgi:glycosyltransferase involved in cell wall biosynthesis
MLPLLSKHFDIEIIALTSSNFNLNNVKKNKLKQIIQLTIAQTVSSFRSPLKKKNLYIIRYPIPENRITTYFAYLFQSIIIAWILKIRKIGNDCDICLVSPGQAGFPALLAKLDIPIVFEDVDRFEFFTHVRFKKIIVRFMESFCIRNSDLVISAGYNLAKSAEKTRKKPIALIPNGVDFTKFNSMAKKMVESNFERSDIVYLGSISEWSGLDIVIQSMPKILQYFPSTKLYIIGTGEEHLIARLNSLSLELGISGNVVFMGKKSHNELPDILPRFLIGVATFPDTELMRNAFPLKILEYMAAGLIVIATDVGDTGCIIRESGGGLLVSAKPDSIASGVCRIIENSSYANLLSNNGQKWVKDFDIALLSEKEANLLASSFSR